MCLRENVSRATGQCIQAQHVLTPQPRDRARKYGGAARALADLKRPVQGERIARGTTHQLQRISDFLVGNNIEERRLPKAHRKRLLERVVKDCVPGLVGEVREDHSVGGSKRVGLAREEEPTAQGHSEQHNHHAGRGSRTGHREKSWRACRLDRARA